MAAATGIEWAHHTWSPWVGCTKVSPACDHCYAESWAKRSGQPALWQGKRRRTSAAAWDQLRKWNRAAAAAGERRRVFPSLCDPFDNQVPELWRTDMWTAIRDNQWLNFLLLTKRPQNISSMLPVDWGDDGYPNVWLGATAENQKEADRRIPYLCEVPAVVHFLSCEPLLDGLRVDEIERFVDTFEDCGGHPDPHWPPDSQDVSWFDALRGRMNGETQAPDGTSLGTNPPELSWKGYKVDWVICGGESGPGARPMHPNWARSLRDQCRSANVPFFFKQWGEWHPCEMRGGVGYQFPGAADFDSWRAPVFDRDMTDGINFRRLGKKRAGRLLDGVEHNAVPGAC